MKKIVLLAFTGGIIISALVGGIMLSYTKEEPIKDYLVLSGTIDNFKRRDIKLEGFDFEKKILFDKKAKTFLDTIRLNRDGYYKIVVNKRRFDIFLTKTEDLKITLDYKNPDAITFEGVNGVTGKYFLDKKEIFAEEVITLRELLTKEETDFLTILNGYKESLSKLLTNSQLPEAFIKKETKNIEYEYLRNLYYYPSYYPALSGDEEYSPSGNFPSVSDKINFNEGEDYQDFAFYQNIVKDEIQRLADEKSTEDTDIALNYLETVHTEVSDSIVKNNLLFDQAQKGITYTDNLEGYYRKYMAFSSNKAQKDRMTEIYNSLKLTAKGMPCPKFENYENIEGGTTSMDDLLSSGKYLYIDVWATWCSFCKRETPLLKRLELQYHDENIEFVSISVDNINAKSKWKETIEQKEMGGVQLFADKSFGSDFIKKFAIKGLPRFILVDPEGNIISPNAPRPSDGPKLTKMFEEIGISI